MPPPPQKRGRGRPRGSVYWHATAKKWCAQTPPDRRGQRRSRYFADEDAAWAWIDGIVAATDDGADLAAGSEKLGAYLRRWLDREKANPDRDWAASTVKLYTWAVEKVAEHKLARTPVADLVRDDTDDIIADLADDLSRKSVGIIRALVRSALADLEDAGTIRRNPVRKARPNRYEDDDVEDRVPWTEDEMRTFLATARKHSKRAALWWLVLSCGLRSGEVRAARLDGLDLANSTLTFYRQKTRKTQTLDLPRNVVAALRAHLKERKAIGGHLFPADRAAVMSANVLLRELQDLRRKAGITPIGRVHDLRHVAGSLMLANGYPVPTVAAILGHKTPDTTMRIYAHAIPKHVIRAPRNIADILPYDEIRTAPAVNSAVKAHPLQSGQGVAFQLTVR